MGEAVGAIVGVGILILFGMYIVGVISSGIQEQNQQMAAARFMREMKKEQKQQRAFFETGLIQMLSGANQLTGRHLLANDGALHSYERADVDWKKVWREASNRGVGVPPFGVRPFWTPTGPSGRPAPFSTLAFMDKKARLRIAEDPDTDPTAIAILAGDDNLTGRADRTKGDPDHEVFTAASKRL